MKIVRKNEIRFLEIVPIFPKICKMSKIVTNIAAITAKSYIECNFDFFRKFNGR